MATPAADPEMQVQVDDYDELDDCEMIETGTEVDLLGSPASPVLELQKSESTYDATRGFSNSKPLHCQVPLGTVFNGRYKVNGVAGKGAFGCAYTAINVLTGEEVVIKARVSTMGDGMFSESIDGELQVYLQLGARERQIGIPYIAGAGVHKLVPNTPDGKSVYVSYIVMQRLGDSIWSCCHKLVQRTIHDAYTGAVVTEPGYYQPSRESVVFAGTGMLKALCAMHARGFVHRDVKSENFCLGRNVDCETIYAIDYGFARPAFGWYPYHKYTVQCASFWGTPNYASLDSLMRYPQTSRDDLEALAYCVMEMEVPRCLLPWNSRLTTNSEAAAGWTDEQLDRMARDKARYYNTACSEGLVPDYLQTFMAYVQHLQPWDIPDYGYLQLVLQSGLTGEQPSRKPLARRYKGWPAGAECDHKAVTQSLLEQLHEAASVLLRETQDKPIQYTSDAAVDAEASTASLQQQAHSRHVSQQVVAMSASVSGEGCYSDLEESDVDGGTDDHVDSDECEVVDSAEGYEVLIDDELYENGMNKTAAAVGMSNGMRSQDVGSPAVCGEALEVESPELLPMQQHKRQRVGHLAASEGAAAVCFGADICSPMCRTAAALRPDVLQAALDGSQEE